MKIGNYQISSPYVLAPMAGVTDLPFRKICRRFGAGLAVSEMVNANPELWETEKSQLRLIYEGELSPVSAQIVGYDPKMMAAAAQFSVENGAEIVDINMGCPAKKVCKKAAGSALLQDEALVGDILKAVVAAVDVPVTLKIRTGWDRANKNAVTIAKMAESIGIQALAIHGRTREDRFLGEAEYETIAKVKEAISIPVIANGDIDSLDRAKEVLAVTKADAIMIGRGALGNPWLFRSLIEEKDYQPTLEERYQIVTEHISALHHFYGIEKGIRVARKHILWYLGDREIPQEWRSAMLREKIPEQQLAWIDKIFLDPAIFFQ
ncbi:tRNA dihydrouridine synthase DusB [Ignatzschineria cameli]|uniref:tRNA-dihydrouridine synthase B n=1 Tax=Ignatzschineria cameli TaxID=2182793 RepID=A0A2U2APS9_9GAMM|nr:tRNA dihydrouridine synthase DusB [Ignatzschineria cameli]PWD83380.1 tRNA dihydrouridine synthase DusB [Ignatzschineria cameli]PWD85498.1 tRNA dihydrouridine synthase DusB [Ignatzschineria cameli]PWD89188.1 tRNA dihydrouridine synthase DusB [Ignatzschineria cameli]PWD90638.1 tRNA dihydrouridine synthase DusB [Ignatzschineria cameli]PWD91342.1 tRNA dihydrouridine synthase DusB [Ignatzschineria cameli]